jgi:hypothetical protein
VKPRARLLWVALLLAAGSLLHAGEREVDALAAVDYFASGGVGFGGTTSTGETLFKKIHAEKNNLEQFVVVYGRGNNAARMYALVAFYRLNRPLYDHLKAQYQGHDVEVPVVNGCDAYTDRFDVLIENLEKGRYDSLFPKDPQTSR